MIGRSKPKTTRTKAAKRSSGSGKKASPRRAQKARFSKVRESAPVFLVVLASLAVLIGLAALPARTWIDQKRNTAEVSDELGRVEAEVSELQLKLEVLETDEEVERMARENFDLVYPGEESYRILPAPEE